jgi:hypothetical protein
LVAHRVARIAPAIRGITMIIRTIIEILAALVIILMVVKEPVLITFEDKVLAVIKRWRKQRRAKR